MAGGGVFGLLRRILPAKDHHKGGILIEFTFSIPLCIMLLFFINDHYRFYELKNKVKNSAYFAASMLQQIKNTKSDKQLTKEDFGRIAYASCLNFFHTNTMFTPWPFGVFYDTTFAYVKKIDSGTYQYQMTWACTLEGTSPSGIYTQCGSVVTRTQAQVEAIHPDLVCNNIGEERVLISCYYRKHHIGFKNKGQLGFFILEPKTMTATNGRTAIFFMYDLVITPKPGFFPAKTSS